MSPVVVLMQGLQCIVATGRWVLELGTLGIGVSIDCSHAQLDPAGGLYRPAALNFAQNR